LGSTIAAQKRITLHELEQVLMQPGRNELKECENRWPAVTAAIDQVCMANYYMGLNTAALEVLIRLAGCAMSPF
jgi:hypothetical protein